MNEEIFSIQPPAVDAPWDVAECVEDLAAWLEVIPEWLTWDGRRFVRQDDGRIVDLTDSIQNILLHVEYARALVWLALHGKQACADLLRAAAEPLLECAADLERDGDTSPGWDESQVLVDALRFRILSAAAQLRELHRVLANPTPLGYLGLIVDHEHRTIGRDKHDAVVDLRSKPALWDMFIVFLAGGTSDASDAAWQNAIEGELSGRRQNRARLKEELAPLGITIPNRGKRLVDDGA